MMFEHEKRKLFMDKLASNLGIDEQKLDQAFKEAAKDTAEEAFKTGYLTNEQFDRIKNRLEHGKAGGIFGRPWAMVAQMHQGRDAVFDAMAKRLGETKQDLESQLSAGKPLSEIAQEKGVSEEELRHTVVSTLKPRLDEAVRGGKITPKMAEAVLHRMEQTPSAPKAA